MYASDIERREILLADIDFRAFELPLIVVERNVVVRLESCGDTSNLRVGYLEERGGGLLFVSFRT